MTGQRASAITIQLNYRFPLPTGLCAAEETLALNFRVILKKYDTPTSTYNLFSQPVWPSQGFLDLGW